MYVLHAMSRRVKQIIKTTMKNAAIPLVLTTNATSATTRTLTDLESVLPGMKISQPERSKVGVAVGAHKRPSNTEKHMKTAKKAKTAFTPCSTALSAARGSASSSQSIAGESSTTTNAEVQMKGTTDDISADDTDAIQKSDSDEDGYSNIDFNDDDYQLIEHEEIFDEYDPAWAQVPIKSLQVFNYEEKYEPTPKSDAPISYFENILGSRTDFFTKLAQSCSAGTANTNIGTFCAEDLQIFMGICLQMSSIRLFEMEQYWNENAHFGFVGFGDKMKRNVFKKILNVLNFDLFKSNAEISVEFSSKKFSKVTPLLNYFNTRMESVYICDRQLILDEPLIYWKGKFHWLNEVKTKLRCNAVMLHFLSEPSGLILRIVPDLEESERKQLTRNSKPLVLQRLTIAMDVLNPKLGKGHIVYSSKYYSSYALALELKKRQTYSSGFLDCNRFGNSKEVILASLDKGHGVARYAGDIMMAKYRHREKSFCCYKSNRSNGLSTESSSPADVVKELEMILCQQRNIRSKILNCQTLLPCTELKWDKRLMIYVMNLLVLNAYILYTKDAASSNGETTFTFELFRQQVIMSLLKTKLVDNHVIQIIPKSNGKPVKKRCQICRKGGLTTYSKYSCKICPGMPGLCETPCFKMWHDQLRKSEMATSAAV